MFTDIVGYTSLMARDERKAFEVLRKNLLIHESAINEFHGKLIKELGDGLLVSFPTVSDALNASIKIQRLCKETGEFELSIGIHQGEVVVDKGDIFGDVVNIASRIRALGSPGSVLFSHKVADEIKNKAEFKAVKLGRFRLKNVAAPVEVFALGNDGLTVPKRSDIQGKFVKTPLAVSIAVILVLLLAGYLALNNEQFLPAGEEKSIVVLPFNFIASEIESGNKYLADGFHLEIINRLSAQKNLLVIAPDAARQARDAKWAAEEIHKRLNVQYILDGTVQKDGNRLHISTRLIDATTGTVIDTKTLERTIDDYFSLQKEVAIKVVRDAGLVVSKGLETYHGTENLKALRFFSATSKYPFTSRSKKDTDSLVWLLHRALKEDSMYLNPLYSLVVYHFFRYDVEADTTQLRAGVKALERMIEIDKSSISTQLAQAQYSNYVLKNYALAIEQYDAVLRRSPYNYTALIRRGLAYRRLGRYQEYLDTWVTRFKVNPLILDAGIYREMSQDLLKHGQTHEAKEYIKRLRSTPFVGDYFYYSFNHAVLENRWDKLDSLVNEAEELESEQFGVDRQAELVFYKERLQAFYHTERKSMLHLFSKGQLTRSLFDTALVLHLTGDSASSRTAFMRMKQREESKYKKMRGSQYGDNAWINLATCRAALGEPGWKEEFGRIKSQLAGTFYGKVYNGYVMACLFAGETELAFKLLGEWKEENIPYPLGNDYIGIQELLKDHPLLDPLRGKPGFEELWEGNHLKLKPLKIPKELLPR